MKHQKCWPLDKEWWLQKTVLDGMDAGLYELTITVNRVLLAWNAQAVLVDKLDNLKLGDEP